VPLFAHLLCRLLRSLLLYVLGLVVKRAKAGTEVSGTSQVRGDRRAYSTVPAQRSLVRDLSILLDLLAAAARVGA